MVIKQKNQKFKITTGIRNSLSKYHESKIFRELVQNAEDAGANEVIIKLDSNSYGTDKLFYGKDHQYYNNLKDLQGPSIIIYNNGVFKDSDWEGIEYIGEGSKKKDMLSIGNFGLGFNSTYHITDCPQIVSGRRMWFLDPMNLIGDGIECEDFTEMNYQDYQDQFKPFEQFGCNMKQYFAGTIIRLPLRLVTSQVKEKPVTFDGCIEILQDFYKEVREIPIFLKVISSITLIGPNLYFNVQVKNHSAIQEQRKKVGQNLKSIVNTQMKDKTDNYEFNDIISRKNQDDFKSIYQLDMETTLTLNGITTSNEISYIVSQGILVSDQLNDLVVDSEIKLISYGGVAIPVKVDSSSGGGSVQIYDQEFQGKPFCFLPIGNQTISSKSHVFGYYILSDARSEVQYSCQSSRQNTQEYKALKWNQFISNQVVPYFYIQALHYMTQFEIDLVEYFPYQYLISGSGDTTFEKDFSHSTMNLIFNQALFINHFSNNKSPYNHYNQSIIIKNNTPQFIIDYLNSSNIPTILLNDSFISYLQNNRIQLSSLISPMVLCSLLSKYQLNQYSKDILNYVCSDEKVIVSGSLNNINLLPNSLNVDFLFNIGIGSLQVTHSLQLKSNFIVVSKDIYSLLHRMQANLDCILDESQMGDHFIKNFELIKKHYVNIKSIDINLFLSKVNIKYASLYQSEIWSTIESLYSFHSNNSNVNEQIAKLPIFPYASQTNTSYTSYSNSKVFSSLFFNNFSDKIKLVFYKLNFIMVECSGAASRFLLNYDTLDKSTSRLLVAISNVGSLDKILSTNEITVLRTYVFNLLNQSYHSFDKWGKTNQELFFSIPFHKCIGDPNKQFTSITNQSMCINFTNILDYEIIGKELVLLDSYIYDTISEFPTKSVYKEEVQVYLHYLLPSISKFNDIKKPITIINDFVYKHISNLKKEQVDSVNWILTTENKFINLNNLYHLNNQEIEIFKVINPHQVIHEDLLDISSQLFNRKFIRGVSQNDVVDKAIKYLQWNHNDQKVYQLLLEYFNLVDSSLLEKFSKTKFISNSLVDTYQGFESKSPLLSISEVTVIENKDIAFSVKYPVHFNRNSAIYNYLKDDKDSVFEHWFRLLQQRDSIQTSNLDLATIFDSIYKTVSKIRRLTQHQEKLLEQIKDLQVLWYQDKFINSNRLYIEGRYELQPFYYKISMFSYPIFKSFNMVKKNLALEDFYTVLSEIQQKKEITIDLIQIYCHCLKLISTNYFNQTINKKSIKSLPTVDNQLIQFDKVVFSEAPIPASDGYYQLHKEIDFDTVEKLDISTFQQKLQEIHELSFGQKEELVARLQSIIRDYRIEGFLNEMIQNASDANATQFKMFLDENSYKSQHTNKRDVPPDLENYLSSSLIIYNNSTFSDRDIQNVQNISRSLKKKEESAIGYNGLGINSAYNFSNIISILSGKYLMILDPFISHIPVSPSKATGCKYEIKKCFEQYKDYFQPFIKFKKLLNLDFNNEEFNGTIIRLPLRKNNIKEKNISESKYNAFSILKLFKQYENNKLHNCMLFTNINDIEIGQFSGDSYNVLYKTTKNQAKPLESRLFNNFLDVIPMDVHEQSYSIFNRDHQISKEKRFIVGSSRLFESNQKFLDHLPEEHKIKRFLTLYNEEKRKPYGSIAFEISVTDGSYISGQTCKSFCYLPCRDIDLPFNVNGFFNMTQSRDIYDYTKATNIELVGDVLKHKANVRTQQLESFLIYWNTLLIEEFITPIFIKTLVLYKENYISISKQPDASNYMNLTLKYYKLFPNNSNLSKSIFHKLISKFYQLSTATKFNYLIPHPEFHSKDKDGVKFLCSLDRYTLSISVLKLFSNYGSVYFITDTLCEQLDLSERVIKPELLSKILYQKELPQNVISNNEFLFDILVYLGFKLANGCQLLKLNNGTLDYITYNDSLFYGGSTPYERVNNKEHLLYNEEYYNLIKNNSKINKDELFIDIKYSEKLSLQYGTSLLKINILQLSPLQFFFKAIYPNYVSFTLDQTETILNFLKKCFFNIYGVFKVDLPMDQHQIIREKPLIPSNYKGIPKLYPITSLYSFEFKKMSFDLIYPLDCFNTPEWCILFKYFGIRNYLDKASIESEFKRLSSQYYSLKDDDGDIQEKRRDLLGKSDYLWLNVSKMRSFPNKEDDLVYKELFDTILELNIVPTAESNIFGSLSNRPLLGRISNCYDTQYEKLLFTVKFKSKLNIEYPVGHTQFTNEDVYQNLVNILANHNQWPKKNRQHDDTMFDILRFNLQYLENQLRTNIKSISNYQQHTIRSLPIQETDQSIPFENIIFENTSFAPFFTSLPSFYSNYPKLFKLLGVQSIDNQETIINRLNQILHHQLNSSQILPFRLLCENKLNHRGKSIPILTEDNYLKPKSSVIYVDDKVIYNRININGILWVANNMYHGNIDAWSIQKLSTIVKESINLDLTKLKNSQSLDFEIFNTEFLKDPQVVSLLESSNIGSTKRSISTIQIKYGSIYVKTLLKNGDVDISNNQATSYYYDSSSKILYLDERADLYSTLERALGFTLYSLKNIFNRISATRNDSRSTAKYQELVTIIKSSGSHKFYGFYRIASEKNEIVTLLHGSCKYDDVFIYCNKSIEYSIKSVLEYQNKSYNAGVEINKLKRLSNNFQDLSEPSSFQTNVNLFKTSLCHHSNHQNSAEILNLSNQYLRKAKSIINN